MTEEYKRPDDTYEIISWLEERLSDGEFHIVDFWLEHAELDQMSDTGIIGALSMTFHGKHELTKRDGFLLRAEVHLKDSLGIERANKLLKHRR
jgi:hypothetical protein